MKVIFVSTQLTKDIRHYLINIFGYTAPIWPKTIAGSLNVHV